MERPACELDLQVSDYSTYRRTINLIRSGIHRDTRMWPGWTFELEIQLIFSDLVSG